ncbi:putative phosphoesterase [Pullulanibacillus pueri]|uniref:Phosphoesterase n=1 Tax=Pullulanibacillus pueri TaxID=1437324 RepID=A0A8J2ZX00_9BACL|nr:metallophosphoesterase [Pullulanibacillus pueri]MBM7681988.1 putative phosphoesterase [Pullulanibacillus pueri]GGH83672.1 putative metallophosphoesterase YsnB [Pullulanibacillus pueri]
MKLLVVSDSHGLENELQIISERHPEAEMLIHCGDSELEMTHLAMTGYQGVAGNCDWPGAGYPNDRIIDLEDGAMKVFVTHGHLYNVKMTEMNLIYKAEEVGANLVCFGHTHYAGSEQTNGMIVLNPGSIRMPRGRKEPTYALLDWDRSKRQLSLEFYTPKGEKVSALGAVYQL